jgi:NAD(P)-dependent dehydrogenase (short-subunit alcohol dehydrogenase family)
MAGREHARIIITGASDGIGAEMARQLAAVPAIAAADPGRAQSGGNCRPWRPMPGPWRPGAGVPTDVSDEAACRALIERSVQQFGGWMC